MLMEADCPTVVCHHAIAQEEKVADYVYDEDPYQNIIFEICCNVAVSVRVLPRRFLVYPNKWWHKARNNYAERTYLDITGNDANSSAQIEENTASLTFEHLFTQSFTHSIC